MSKKLRNFIFYFFIVLFIFGTVTLSLYASGYKFNLSFPLEFNRLLVKTGMLALDSSPKGATIYINNKTKSSNTWQPWKKELLKTPAKIKNLIPGQYEITIEKAGYSPFSKTITVESGLTTFYEDISLFKADNPSIKALSEDLNDEEKILLSPDNNFLYLEKSARIINLDKDEDINILAEYNPASGINILNESPEWQKNNKLFLGGIFFSADKNKEENFLNLVGSEAHDWKNDSSNNKLYYQTKSGLAYINSDNKEAGLVLKKNNIEDYLPNNQYLFVIEKSNNNTFLETYGLENNNVLNIISLPNDGDYSFKDVIGDFITIYDSRNQSLYIINKNSADKIYKKIENVKDWQVNGDEGLFFINDWELQYFNLKAGYFNLLVRLGTNLKELALNKNKNYIILTSNQEIIIFDLKTTYLTSILKAEKIASPVLDEKSDLLYFWSQLEDQQGVYRISIK